MGPMIDDEPQRRGRTWHFPDGTTLPVVSGGMGDDGAGAGDDGAGDDDSGAGSGDAGATYSQDDVNRMVGERLARDRRAREKEIEDTLGMTTEEAAQALAASREAERERMTEIERREAEAAERAAAAERREAAAAERERAATIREGIVRAGVTDPDLQADVALLLERPLSETDDLSTDAVDAQVAALKDRRPELFGQSSTTDSKPPPSGAPAGGPPPGRDKGGSVTDSMQRGKERALAMQGRTES